MVSPSVSFAVCLEGCTTGSIQVICSCLRTHLRFRAFEGDRIEALIASVSRVPNWRLALLPKALTDQELKQFLAAFDRATSGEQRDYSTCGFGCAIGGGCASTAVGTWNEVGGSARIWGRSGAL
jgi:hypothetical protein